MSCEWSDKIFRVTEQDFRHLSLEIFHFQSDNCRVYNSFIKALGIDTSTVDRIERIPFLPVSFFKTHTVKTGEYEAEQVFESSGTTQTINSRHHVKDASIYKESFLKNIETQYGSLSEWCIIGLLPSYLERNNSSLVYMVDSLIKESGHPSSGFYLDEFEKLNNTIRSLENNKQKTLLIGVTYALLDFSDKFPQKLNHTIVMETGGMKGRRQELTRMEVHEQLKNAFGLANIHSEYGMTELLSQAYSKQEGRFHCPPWMKVMIRDDEDPLTVFMSQREAIKPINGAINIIDLANVFSCSFIATDDAGRLFSDGSFEVLGRIDGSDLRGCSLLAF